MSGPGQALRSSSAGQGRPWAGSEQSWRVPGQALGALKRPWAGLPGLLGRLWAAGRPKQPKISVFPRFSFVSDPKISLFPRFFKVFGELHGSRTDAAWGMWPLSVLVHFGRKHAFSLKRFLMVLRTGLKFCTPPLRHPIHGTQETQGLSLMWSNTLSGPPSRGGLNVT